MAGSIGAIINVETEEETINKLTLIGFVIDSFLLLAIILDIITLLYCFRKN